MFILAENRRHTGYRNPLDFSVKMVDPVLQWPAIVRHLASVTPQRILVTRSGRRSRRQARQNSQDVCRSDLAIVKTRSSVLAVQIGIASLGRMQTFDPVHPSTGHHLPMAIYHEVDHLLHI